MCWSGAATIEAIFSLWKVRDFWDDWGWDEGLMVFYGGRTRRRFESAIEIIFHHELNGRFGHSRVWARMWFSINGDQLDEDSKLDFDVTSNLRMNSALISLFFGLTLFVEIRPSSEINRFYILLNSRNIIVFKRQKKKT